MFNQLGKVEFHVRKVNNLGANRAGRGYHTMQIWDLASGKVSLQIELN